MKNLDFGQLYGFEHDERGIWYFSSIMNVAYYCNIPIEDVIQMIDGDITSSDEWEYIGIVNYEDIIDKSWIDPK